MIKTADGEKIYPEEIEDKLLDIDEVTSAMVCAVHGHLTAVLFLKENSEENRKKVTEAIDRINSGAANYCKIADIRFREKPFPMTTSLKIRRAEVMKEIEDCGNCKKTAAPPETEMQRIIREYVIQLLPDAEEISIDITTAIVNGGDDCRLMYVFPLEYHEKIRKEYPFLEIIGHTAKEGCHLVSPDGNHLQIKAQGWQ